MFGSLLLTLNLCHWRGICVFFVYCELIVYVIILEITRCLVVAVRLWPCSPFCYKFSCMELKVCFYAFEVSPSFIFHKK